MKKLISATLAASLALSLAACGSSASTDSVAASSEAASTESTAASSEAAESTAETSELAPYLDSFNEENGTHLVSVGAVHYEPFGIYPGKSDDLANIADGATIAVPNDTTNEARALQLLAAQGLITVRDGAGLTATVNDITDNPHNLQIKEIEAAQLPRTVQDVDFAVINGNYAMEAGFSVGTDALAIEDASSEAAQTYANVLVVKEGNENDPAIQALYAALTSDTIKDFINNTYDGAVNGHGRIWNPPLRYGRQRNCRGAFHMRPLAERKEKTCNLSE